MLSALDWVADHDPGVPGARKIVSMSVGGPRSAVIDAAVRELVSAGVVVVAAAGNSGRTRAGRHPPGGGGGDNGGEHGVRRRGLIRSVFVVVVFVYRLLRAGARTR